MEFADAFPSIATTFALSGTVSYGSFTAPVAAVVSQANKTVTLYIAGTTAGVSSLITLKGQAAIDSATPVVEVSFVLTARDSAGQIPPAVEAPGYYATAAELDVAEAAIASAKTRYTATWYNAVSISASTLATAVPLLWVAPFACTLNYAALVSAANSMVASDTNYWSVELRRYRAGVAAAIATKTSQATGGEAVPQYTPWVFGTLDATNKVLQAGDVVALFFTKTAGAATWTNLHATIGYTLT